jgi:MerR family transcriptional regulator, light-induced transcriptional regulator
VSAAGLIRIGELSRRAGVSVDRLRAWERRYGLFDPVRTPGGFRLYSPADEARVRAMREQLAGGVSAAQAAAAVLAPVRRDVPAPDVPRRRRAELAAALTGFDEPRALGLLDGLLAELGDEPAMDAVIFPVLRQVGEGWASGELHVGQEHFASTLVETRLLQRFRALTDPAGPPALLACAPGERHTFGLIGLAIALRRRGRSVAYLGADTPVPDLMRSIEQLDPAVVVLSAVMAGRFHHAEADLREVGARVPLALAGPGAGRVVADRIGARLLEGDPLTAADALTGSR